MNAIKIFDKKLTSFQIILIGFAGVILLGALLLMLPISSRSGNVTDFRDTLFTATSAVCVTGLVVKDTASYWSYFGQAIIIVLIQIGGLGVITVASMLSMLAGRKISFAQRQTIQNAIAAPQVGGVVRLTRFIVKTSIAIEALGALLLMPVFAGRYGAEGIWMSVFHSISAFCNAGFDLMGTKTGKFSSLTFFSNDLYLNIVISFLIVAGGIGFLAWKDISEHKFRFRDYTMQTKVIIVTTMILIIVPFILYLLIDFSKGTMNERVCLSLFQTITPRTAGFNTANLSKMTDAGITLMMILMLIGGSPGSTAGGMKTTTAAVLFANTIAVFGKKKNAKFFNRRIDDAVVKNASTVFFMYFSLSVASAIAISLIEGLPMEKCLFETISAIATVGLTLGITPGLNAISHFILIGLMFFGRVGGLTIIYAAFSPKDTDMMKYPAGNITVG
jgi:trk system potassium uptake protein TrkH